VAKVSVDEFVGRRKAFIEEMRHFMGLVSSRNAIALVEQGKGMMHVEKKKISLSFIRLPVFSRLIEKLIR